jgi:hypothetical protein
MSDPILPFAPWAPGTNQNSIPANDNSLRLAILNGLVLGTEDDDPGGSADGDIYIVGSTPAGDFATFDENDLAIYDSGTWYAWAPVAGIVINLAGSLRRWDGSGYVSINTAAPVVTESTASRDLEPSDSGSYIRFTYSGAKSLLVQDDTDGPFAADSEYHGRNANTGDLTLTEDTSVTINPPAGGTLVIPEGGTFTLKRVATDEFDLFGVTVPA